MCLLLLPDINQNWNMPEKFIKPKNIKERGVGECGWRGENREKR
jgi:hypothetical protein